VSLHTKSEFSHAFYYNKQLVLNWQAISAKYAFSRVLFLSPLVIVILLC